MTVKNNKHSHSSKYISVGRGYSVMFSVMLSLAVLILVGSFCHCTSAKSIEGDWSSLDPLHDEQQDARIATLSASQLLTELVFRLDIVECPVAEPSQKLAIKITIHHLSILYTIIFQHWTSILCTCFL